MADDGTQQRKPGFRTAVEDVKAIAAVFAMEAESVLGRRTARFLGVLVLFAVVVGTLLSLLEWYIAPTDAEQKQALVVTLAQILGGAALLSGLYFTWRTVQVNREGQITERFTRAIDQLGAPKLEIRLGGIYALERIDKDSPERDYHSTVMEVLTAYIRENAPWPPTRPSEPPKLPDGDSVSSSGSDEAAERDKGAEQGAEPTQRTPSTDIQAILDVLKRREEERVPEKHRIQSLDLRGTDLRGANLSGAHLEGANLVDAHLEGANFFEAHLEGAHLIAAHLERARLIAAHLERADLYQAHLEGADLYQAHLEGADLSGAILLKAQNLLEAQLEQTTGDENTRLPSNLKPPAHWRGTTFRA